MVLVLKYNKYLFFYYVLGRMLRVSIGSQTTRKRPAINVLNFAIIWTTELQKSNTSCQTSSAFLWVGKLEVVEGLSDAQKSAEKQFEHS